MFGVAVTSGAAKAELRTTSIRFELTVSFITELSVTLSLNLQVPVAVEVVVEKMLLVPFAPVMSEKGSPLKDSSH